MAPIFLDNVNEHLYMAREPAMEVLPLSVHAATLPADYLLTGRVATARNATGVTSTAYGPLSDQQLKTLRAAVGYDFNWPPRADSGAFPMAAVVLSQRVMSGDIAAQKELTTSGLRNLAAAGLLSGADLARGTAYLRNGSPENNAAEQASAAQPVSGTVAADGSVYL